MDTITSQVESGFSLLQDLYAKTCLNADVTRVCQRNIRMDQSSLFIKENPVSLNAFKKVFIIGAGIAALPKAQYLENLLGSRITRGIILVPPDTEAKLNHIQVREVTSPLIDPAGSKAVKDILYLLESAAESDLVILLLSKGANEMLELLHEGITYNDYALLLKNLRSHGAERKEINAIRMHMSQIKGGQLLRFIKPATTIALILPDHPEDAEGSSYLAPTSFDPATFQYCRQVMLRYKIALKLPPSLLNHFNNGMQGKIQETVKNHDPLLSRAFNFVLHNGASLSADALLAARERKIPSTILSTRFQGTPDHLGKVFGSILRDTVEYGVPHEPPFVYIATGRITGSDEDRLKSCADLAFSTASEISGFSNIWFLAASSFNHDPASPVGCIVNGDTIPGIVSAGIDPIDIKIQDMSLQAFKKMELLLEGSHQLNDCGDIFIGAVIRKSEV